MVNRALNSLDLCKNNLGEASETIAQAVLQHPTMEVFCKIPMKKMREDSLTELDLSRKRIRMHGAMVIAPLLQFSRALKSANLGGNGIGDEGTAALSDALKTNSTLEILELRSNKVGAAGAQSLADMLQVNRALKSADLVYNDIGDEGTAALSEALKSNSTLEELKLVNNEIGAAGAQSLAGMLQVNRALTTLDLASNDIGVPDGWSIERDCDGFFEHYKHTDGRTQEERPQGTNSGIVALAGSLKVNRSLTSVDLRYNDIPEEAKQQLRDSVGDKSITLRL